MSFQRKRLTALLLVGTGVCVVLVVSMFGFHLSRWAVGRQLEYYCYHTFPRTNIRLHCIETGLEKNDGR